MNSFASEAQQLIASFASNPDTATAAALPLSEQFNQFIHFICALTLTITPLPVPGVNVYALIKLQEQLVAQYPTNVFMQITSVIYALIFIAAVTCYIASPTRLQYAYALIERFRYRKEAVTLSFYNFEKKKWQKQSVVPGRSWKYDESAQLWKLKPNTPEESEQKTETKSLE